jgi:hypothetical protein
MAIPKESPKIQVEILVDGVALPEYNDSDQEQAPIGPITRYVEARWGADFAIRYRLYDKAPRQCKDQSIPGWQTYRGQVRTSRDVSWQLS